MKKILLTCLLFVGLGMTGFAQSDKMKEKAAEKVEELNAQIMAGDTSQALTEDQKKQILIIQIEKLKELRKIKKADGDKEDRKEVNKKYSQKINKEILTKAQRKAKKAGKDKMKE